MTLLISDYGDTLEKKYSNLINEKLSSYQKIWEIYIGNRGDAKLLEIPELNNDESERRISFSQHHYTCLESIICMKFISEQNSSKKIDDLNKYLEVLNDLMAFNSHAGRIKDQVERIGILFNNINLKVELEKYYQQRNEVLHGRKLPIMIIEKELAIPKIKGNEENPNDWQSSMSWDSVNPNIFEFISSYFEETFNEVIKKLDKSLYKLIKPIKAIEKKYGFNLENLHKNYKKTIINDNSAFGPVSGSTIEYIVTK